MTLKYKLKLPRDLNALTMVGRKTGAFKDQRKGRGGSRNDQQDYLTEYEEACLEDQDTDEEGS